MELNYKKLVLDYLNEASVLITETNIPNKENLTYFGDKDEAHWIYNFTLAPLILFTLTKGDSSELRKWSMTMPPAKNGLWGAYSEIIPTILKQAKDPNYVLEVPVPSNSNG